MLHTPSFREAWRRVSLRAGLAASVLALTAGLAIVPAAAVDEVAAAKAQAAAAAQQVAEAKARADRSSQAVGAASSTVDGSQQKVDTAGTVLTKSEQALSDAQQALYALQQRLQDARDDDARLADELAKAQAALAKAQAEVAAGQARVDAQRALLASSGREAFQQSSPIEGLAVLLGAQTPGDLSSRIQWNTTVFDTQASRKAKLDALLVALKDAQDEQAAIEAKVASDKAASAAQVIVVAGLERQASAQEGTVKALVAANQASLQAAEARLASDQQALGQAQGDLQLSQKAYEQSVAEEAALTVAVKAAIARAAQAAGGGSASGSNSAGWIRPINANPGSPFGMRFHPILHVWRMHSGTDFGAACGSPIYAARSGTVLMAGPNGGYGNFVLVGHGKIDGVYVTTGYAHQNGIYARVGQQVVQGQVIGHVGSTGLSTACHLHFEVRHDGAAVNPLRYVP